ncbi:DEAD/DEAH box helicase [Pedococcus sp. 5OH_020]|uniref:DEAD/DEAH box helicase n=1 Tax=Pedococcus sp. 5OH_020 TaxID=2989814 RepID=UPI0022EA082A|nr:DEAD/DEAH box helicase [Pedococcus sp. 5OH_020]
MGVLLPSIQASDLKQGVVDYLTTTFALADPEARQALDEFLAEPDDGMFKGPYVRLRLPYQPAEDDWRKHLDWDPGLTPYGHQAAAYARLTTVDLGPGKARPLPTLVTTGTGSGKTEAFLHPILDHVVRANRAGVTGMKALILYPMNALANDQAGRLTALLTTHPELSSVTAGIYTGEDQGTKRTTVSEAGLINDRAVMRSAPPDILLTNYKMLDQVLLRQDDQGLWAQSATSLTYLVLDEFHTYDGAQGTDVAMLLRRLGLALKSHWPESDEAISPEDRARPLGKITPVATSATLGDKGDPSTMLDFARTVFGEDFPPDSVVTESRLTLAEWVGDAETTVKTWSLEPRRMSDLAADELAELVRRCDALTGQPEALTLEVLTTLFNAGADTSARSNITAQVEAAAATALLTLAAALPDVQTLAVATAAAVPRDSLVREVFPSVLEDETPPPGHLAVLDHLVAALSHIRAEAGRSALTVELNLWIRELTRIDRDASMTTAYRWTDDGERVGAVDGEVVAPVFPAIYCRHCGRSGWGVELESVGTNLRAEDLEIRRRHAMKEGRFRPLIAAPAEADRSIALGPTSQPEEIPGLAWLSTIDRSLLTTMPDPEDEHLREGRVLPVLTHLGAEADARSSSDMCPSCLQDDGIRFLGSSIATLLSVALSTLFGDADLNAAEKKSLVFTDSVQDAAHRAGFVEARSHTLTARAMFREALSAQRCTLDELVERVFVLAGDDQFRRYRMVPPDCVGREEFDLWWQKPHAASKARTRVKRRLLFDATLEFGLQSTFGRTLERTGAVAVEVDAGSPVRLNAIGRSTFDLHGMDETLDSPLAATPDADVVAWVRGVLERMRKHGGIDHDWLRRYIASDGRRFFIWGGRPQQQGMPAFPSGRAAPAYPRVGGALIKDPLLDSVTSTQSWYALWTARTLKVSAAHGAKLARALFERLAKDDVLTASPTESGGTVYAIPATAISLVPLTDDALASSFTLLVCDVCRAQENGTPQVVAQLDGYRCTGVRCPGHLRATRRSDNFYRRLYASADMRRIVSREHSSLLEDEVRLQYERAFKASTADAGSPNVLVATPTLEMGIDIGDLSTVMLASLPRTVASYLQRVGRAGRLTGNALNVAFVTGRGEHLPQVYEPLSVINGEVRPPATYLDAEEILQRQFIASVVDHMARDASRPMPIWAAGALESAMEGSFLGDLIAEAEDNAGRHLDAFLGTFDSLRASSVELLRAWATPARDDESVTRGSSGLAAMVFSASQRWAQLNADLVFRRQEILETIPGLKAAAEGPAATDDDRHDYRSAVAALRLVERHHSNHRKAFWVAAMEEYGLLPNFTLLDDTVTLDVSVTWRDPETNEFMSEPRTFNRAAALALREFAPGATFYARGLEMDIDGLDLGSQNNLIQRWAWCDLCGYATSLSADGTVTTLTACPRCGGAQIADASQRFDVVELTRVLSDVRRDESRISDDRDERRATPFIIATAADLDPRKVTRQWSVGGGTFGVAQYRALDIRWLNAGRKSASGMSARSVAGQQLPNVMFRVCAACGKADSAANSNSRDEHRPWCRHRNVSSEDTRTVALTRSLSTQAVVLSLPLEVTLGDSFAVPSLAAAVLLGLRERMGGNPDHLDIALVPAPVVGGAPGELRDALLLHDIVPGGTGYLTDLAEPEEMWGLLVTALGVVATCPCKDENRLACHRCLLPFSRGLGIERLSRLAAERHLRTVLGLATSPGEIGPGLAGMRWTVAEGPVGTVSNESHLELTFRKVFKDRLKALNATVKEKPGPTGNILTITLGDHRVWTLTPQQLAHGSKPDFVLRSNDPSIDPVAIFTDGWTFHASPQHNRIADDAMKRNALRQNGFAVLGLTQSDLDDGGQQRLKYDWVRPEVVTALLGQPAGQPGAGFNRDAVAVLTAGPLDFLMSWIQQPHHQPRTALANSVWLLLASDGASTMSPDSDAPLADLASRLLTTPPASTVPDDGPPALWWRQGSVGVLTRIDPTTGYPVETAVALDDSPEALQDSAHIDAWRRWLQLSNAFAGAEHPVVLTSALMAVSGSGSQWGAAGAVTASDEAAMAPEWAELVALASSPLEAGLIRELASADGLPVPAFGEEFANGIPVDLAWPAAKVAVLIEPDDKSVSDLTSDGWTVVEADTAKILAAVATKGLR